MTLIANMSMMCYQELIHGSHTGQYMVSTGLMNTNKHAVDGGHHFNPTPNNSRRLSDGSLSLSGNGATR